MVKLEIRNNGTQTSSDEVEGQNVSGASYLCGLSRRLEAKLSSMSKFFHEDLDGIIVMVQRIRDFLEASSRQELDIAGHSNETCIPHTADASDVHPGYNLASAKTGSTGSSQTGGTIDGNEKLQAFLRGISYTFVNK